MTSNLEHDPTLQEGLGHIREQYADLLPTALVCEPDADEEE